MKSEVKQVVPSPRALGHHNPVMRPRHDVIASEELLAGRRVVIIEHSGEEYRLQMTRKGKLILTK